MRTGNKRRETGAGFLQDPSFPGQGDLTFSAATGGRALSSGSLAFSCDSQCYFSWLVLLCPFSS